MILTLQTTLPYHNYSTLLQRHGDVSSLSLPQLQYVITTSWLCQQPLSTSITVRYYNVMVMSAASLYLNYSTLLQRHGDVSSVSLPQLQYVITTSW